MSPIEAAAKIRTLMFQLSSIMPRDKYEECGRIADALEAAAGPVEPDPDDKAWTEFIEQKLGKCEPSRSLAEAVDAAFKEMEIRFIGPCDDPRNIHQDIVMKHLAGFEPAGANQKRIEELESEVARRKDRERLAAGGKCHKCELHCQHIESLERERKEHLKKIHFLTRKSEGEYWAWQGDGSDNLESLTCPVLIRASDLRELLKPSTAKPVAGDTGWIDRAASEIMEHGWDTCGDLEKRIRDIVAKHMPPAVAAVSVDDRERCATVCEGLADRLRATLQGTAAQYLEHAAAEIRKLPPATQGAESGKRSIEAFVQLNFAGNPTQVTWNTVHPTGEPRFFNVPCTVVWTDPPQPAEPVPTERKEFDVDGERRDLTTATICEGALKRRAEKYLDEIERLRSRLAGKEEGR